MESTRPEVWLEVLGADLLAWKYRVLVVPNAYVEEGGIFTQITSHDVFNRENSHITIINLPFPTFVLILRSRASINFAWCRVVLLSC